MFQPQQKHSDKAPTIPKAAAPPALRTATASGGQALDRHTQKEMSARFGHSFSSVRIHTDAHAGASAVALGAGAYAHGSDIVFGPGKYNPGSRETDHLLTHELTHVAQQAQFGGGEWGRASRSGDESEREADQLASQVQRGENVRVQAAPQAALARYQGDYPWSSPTVDAATNVGRDLAGMIPGYGTIANGAGLAIDLGKAGIDTAFGDTKSANSHLNNATQDALGMIPGVGTALGYGNLMLDSAATGDRLGGGRLNLPTSSEAFDDAAQAPPAPTERYEGGEEGGRAY